MIRDPERLAGLRGFAFVGAMLGTPARYGNPYRGFP